MGYLYVGGKDKYYDKGIFSCAIGWTIQILPLLYEKYSKQNIEPLFEIKSKIYGVEPDYNIIGTLLLPKREPTKIENDEIIEIDKYFFGHCGYQDTREVTLKNIKNYYSYKNNFKLANEMFYYYFSFHKTIEDKFYYHKNILTNKKVLGIHYRGTDKNKCSWCSFIPIDTFIEIVDNEINENNYDVLFFSTDSLEFHKKIKEYFKDKIHLYFIDEPIDDKPLHIKIRNNPSLFEHSNKMEKTENVLLNSLLLSICDKVIKNHSQLSSFAKVFNPNLNVYRVTASKNFFWPECNIPKYHCQNQEINKYLEENHFNQDVDLQIMKKFKNYKDK